MIQPLGVGLLRNVAEIGGHVLVLTKLRGCLAWLEAVQFAVALVRAAEQRKLRPMLLGPEPKPVYLPTEHPPARTRIAFR